MSIAALSKVAAFGAVHVAANADDERAGKSGVWISCMFSVRNGG